MTLTTLEAKDGLEWDSTIMTEEVGSSWAVAERRGVSKEGVVCECE
jgi:hypothetical protein